MATRYIYLAHDLNEILKKESNASALITKLLLDYYNLNSISTKEELIEKEKQIQDIADKELKDIEVKKEEIKTVEEMALERARDKVNKYELLIETTKDNIRNFCLVDESEIQEIAEKFGNDWADSKCNTFFNWCESNGIKLKEEFLPKEQDEKS